MQMHQLQPVHRPKRGKRVGRGGKRGTYSGKGMKGQRSRAGRKMRAIGRELILRIPKRRGAYFKPLSLKPVSVTLETLEKTFASGDNVTPRTLAEKRLVEKVGTRIPKIKILGSGKLSKKLTITGLSVSKGARKAIEQADGKIVSDEKKARA